MTIPDIMTGWTLRVVIYRLKPALVATPRDGGRPYYVELGVLGENVPAHQFMDYLDSTMTVACMALADMIKYDLEKRNG